MKRTLSILGLLALAATLALAAFPVRTYVATVDVDAVGGDWDSFRFRFVDVTDAKLSLTFTSTVDNSYVNWSGYLLRARMSRASAIYWESANTAGTTSNYTFTIPWTNIPPPKDYDIEVLAISGVSTSYARIAAQGRVTVTRSSYSDTNAYPFPATSITNLADYLTIAQAELTYIKTGTVGITTMATGALDATGKVVVVTDSATVHFPALPSLSGLSNAVLSIGVSATNAASEAAGATTTNVQQQAAINGLVTTSATHTAGIAANLATNVAQQSAIDGLVATSATHTAQIAAVISTQAVNTAGILAAMTTNAQQAAQITAIIGTQAVMQASLLGLSNAYAAADAAASNGAISQAAASAASLYLAKAGDTASGALLSSSATIGAPSSNELATAGWVRSLMGSGVHIYNSGETNAASGTNLFFAYLDAAPVAQSSRSYVNPAAGTYIGGVMSTQRYTTLTGPAIVSAWLGLSGGSANLSAEIYYTYSGSNDFLGDWSSGSAGQALTTATSNSYTYVIPLPTTTATNSSGFYVVRRLKVISKTGNPTITVYAGGSTPSDLACSSTVTDPSLGVRGATNITAAGAQVGTYNTTTREFDLTGGIVTNVSMIAGSSNWLQRVGNQVVGTVTNTGGGGAEADTLQSVILRGSTATNTTIVFAAPGQPTAPYNPTASFLTIRGSAAGNFALCVSNGIVAIGNISAVSTSVGSSGLGVEGGSAFGSYLRAGSYVGNTVDLDTILEWGGGSPGGSGADKFDIQVGGLRMIDLIEAGTDEVYLTGTNVANIINTYIMANGTNLVSCDGSRGMVAIGTNLTGFAAQDKLLIDGGDLRLAATARFMTYYLNASNYVYETTPNVSNKWIVSFENGTGITNVIALRP